MGRSKRKNSKPAAVAPALGGDAAFMTGYSGADNSPDRARIFWPTLDTRKEIDSFTRGELMRRIRWFFANEGFIRGLIRNSATLVGYQTPYAKSGDDDWDDLAEKAWASSCLTPEVFDYGGRYDYEDAQLMLKRCRYRDGDVLTVLTESPDGRAQFAFYEAHQLKSPQNPGAKERWRDGVLLSDSNRPLAYGIFDPDKNSVQVIPARDVIYSGQYDSPGNTRATPPLAHAVNHAADITEVWANYKKVLKVSSLFGAIRETTSDNAPRQLRGLAGPSSTASTGVDGQVVETSMVFGAGQIPRLNPGETMKILSDDRPSPNARDLIADLLRDISTGFGLPLEVTWEMGRLTGPGVRLVLDLADRWIKHEQRIDKRWCKRVWVYFIAKEIKAGRLPMPNDGADWTGVGFTAQRNLTIDRSKESTSRLNEIDAGLGTWSQWDDLDGMHWKDRTKQRIKEAKFALEECELEGVPYDVVFRPRPGAVTAPNTKAGEEEKDDDSTPPTEKE